MLRFLLLLLGFGLALPAASQPMLSQIDRVWAGHQVNFALAVSDSTVFVGYYDAERQLTVASRARKSGAWTYRKLDSRVGWDSHNYVAMAVDSAGQLHVAANMHTDPLVYFRTRKAGDVSTLERVTVMADRAREQRMTYPIFLRDAGGRLIFKYRDGGSGNGNEIYNLYDAASGRWSPLLQAPLTDGEGLRNGYFVGPVLGPDKVFHIAWVWRETPMAETNHDLSYARSRDLVHWQKADGTPLALPIRLGSAEIVDPVPVEGGMINNNTVIGFDPAGNAMITYHKFDVHGNTQVFVARHKGKRWTIKQVSDWKGFRWDFRGSGSLDFRLSVTGPVPIGRNRIRISVLRDGKPIDFVLDARTLKRLEERPGVTLAGRLAGKVAVPVGMQLNTIEADGLALAWATRPPNRDKPSADVPAPATLWLVER